MAINESLQIDGLELNPAPGVTSPYSLDEVQFPTPRKRYEWVQGADADGAALVRDPLFEQRTITATVRVTDTTRDLVHDAVAAIEAKLEEAEQQANGLPVVWTPANSTESLTFYCLSGEIGDMPITHESGYFANSVAVPVTLTCKPFGYGSETSIASATSSSPLVTVDVPDVPGDVPAEARIIVTDAASTNRRDVIWGLEQRYYTPGAPSDLTLTASELTTTGFSGISTTRSGAYLSNVISASLVGQTVAVCGTGVQPHVGTFRVRARLQATATVVRLRLTWQQGDGPLSSNAWVSPPTADTLWCEVDLGLITVNPTLAGTQRWTGRIEAYTTDGTTRTLYVNYLALIPAGEGYGRARAVASNQAGVLVAFDDFSSAALGSALNGRTPNVGAAWTTAGATTDWVAVQSPGAFAEMERSTTADASPRVGAFGSAMTDMEVRGMLLTDAWTNGQFGVIARYVDSSNYLKATITYNTGGGGTLPVLQIWDVNAGTASFVAGDVGAIPALNISQWYEIRLFAYASGLVYATLHDGFTKQQIAITGKAVSSRIATGGALASGKPGITDFLNSGVASDRFYDDVAAFTPPAEPIVIYSGRSVEFRHDEVLRYDTTGTYTGRPSTYRGGRALVRPAGDADRTSRVVVAARMSDTETTSDGGVTSSTTVEVRVTPRYLAVPH